MHDLGLGNPSLGQRPETCPRHAVALAPSPDGSEPIPLDLSLEALQTPYIPWHTVIIVMPLDHPPEPGSLVGDRGMTPTHQGRFHGLLLLTHPFFDSSPLDSEALIPVALALQICTNPRNSKVSGFPCLGFFAQPPKKGYSGVHAMGMCVDVTQPGSAKTTA
jgi:hypothetical protein